MLTGFILFLSLAWAKGPSLSPDWAEFERACRQHRSGSESVLVPEGTPVGQTLYLPVRALERGQSTFSFDRVVKGMQGLPKEVREYLKGGRFRYNHGRSVYADDRRITGILYKGKVYIVDGHHRALVSTYLGAKTIPVELIADWSEKSTTKFFADLRKQNLSNYVGLNGEWVGPGEFCDIVNDPLIYLARKLLRRIDLTYDPETHELTLLNERGAKLAVGIKINRDVPFTEQEIARLLRAAGVVWNKGDEITLPLLTRFLEILRDNRDGSRLSQLLLLDHPMTVAELKSRKEEILRAHFERVQCEYQISPGDQD
jgi:hypothetical protein